MGNEGSSMPVPGEGNGSWLPRPGISSPIKKPERPKDLPRIPSGPAPPPGDPLVRAPNNKTKM